ncbi:hypothetical protein [Clostridium cochlearium]|uniref:hypothetical protein n=1 Tax=Clostridium cochlearium TaxID=1494 RepID=UPI00241E20C4|nr:hypothetical protein [Clostridium cochlearium]MBE6065718.1 hypothetical protein [Clostridium cochlearium]
MKDIEYKKHKRVYYVSDISNNTITVVDGEKNIITNVINTYCRPFKLSLYKNKYLYVGSDEDFIIVISTFNYSVRKLNIPNNGIIEIDDLNNRLYVSNCHEVLVYDIESEKKIANIQGFVAVESLKIDSLGKRLFVLDICSKEVRIYNTANFKLILSIKNVGVKPKCITISDDDKVLYIANQGGKDKKSGGISVVNIKNGNIIKIPFQPDSSITSLVLKSNILYAANKGLNRIELVDTNQNKIIYSIKTTLQEPQSLSLTPNKDKLIVTNRNYGQSGALDIIDTSSNCIINTILIKENNTEPYDIVVLDETTINEVEYFSAIVKRIFFTTEETMHLKDIVVVISENYRKSFVFKKVKIYDGFIVKGTERRIPIKNRPNFYRVKFTLRIPYRIKFKHNKKLKNIKKFIEEKKEVILFIPDANSSAKSEININTHCKVINNPILIKDVLSFSLEVFLVIKVVGEIQVKLPLKII